MIPCLFVFVPRLSDCLLSGRIPPPIGRKRAAVGVRGAEEEVRQGGNDSRGAREQSNCHAAGCQGEIEMSPFLTK